MLIPASKSISHTETLQCLNIQYHTLQLGMILPYIPERSWPYKLLDLRLFFCFFAFLFLKFVLCVLFSPHTPWPSRPSPGFQSPKQPPLPTWDYRILRLTCIKKILYPQGPPLHNKNTCVSLKEDGAGNGSGCMVIFAFLFLFVYLPKRA